MIFLTCPIVEPFNEWDDRVYQLKVERWMLTEVIERTRMAYGAASEIAYLGYEGAQCFSKPSKAANGLTQRPASPGFSDDAFLKVSLNLDPIMTVLGRTGLYPNRGRPSQSTQRMEGIAGVA